jgi:hypothetical protein
MPTERKLKLSGSVINHLLLPIQTDVENQTCVADVQRSKFDLEGQTCFCFSKVKNENLSWARTKPGANMTSDANFYAILQDSKIFWKIHIVQENQPLYVQ